MRDEKIRIIEKKTGVSEPWDEWSDEGIEKLYTFIILGAPVYYENIELI